MNISGFCLNLNQLGYQLIGKKIKISKSLTMNKFYTSHIEKNTILSIFLRLEVKGQVMGTYWYTLKLHLNKNNKMQKIFLDFLHKEKVLRIVNIFFFEIFKNIFTG